jgi:hypothetical protein
MGSSMRQPSLHVAIFTLVFASVHCGGSGSGATTPGSTGALADAMDSGAEAGASGASGAGASGAASGSAGSAAGGTSGTTSGTVAGAASGATSGAAGSSANDASAGSYVLTILLVGAGMGEFVASEDGTASCGPGPITPPCSVMYSAGTVVTLQAMVGESDFSFGGWAGAGCSGMGDCVVTMTSAQTVTASFHATLVYTDNENFIVPTGLSTLNVALWGGGGQGGYVGTFNSSLGCYTGTGGGGGGAYNTQSLPVAAGDMVPITVGCGGCVISSDMNQLDIGGDTSFGALLTAGGGGGGYDSPPTGGAGGSCVGPGCIAGSAGTMGSTSSCNGGAGGGAGGPDAGAGGVYGTDYGNGGTPGGGGAGSEGIAGGLGGPGQAVVSW